MSDVEFEGAGDDATPFLRLERVALLVWCPECHAGEEGVPDSCCDPENGATITTVHEARIEHATKLLVDAPDIDGLAPQATVTFTSDHDGDLHLTVAFDPPLNNKDMGNNPQSHRLAGSMAVRLLEGLVAKSDGDEGEPS